MQVIFASRDPEGAQSRTLAVRRVCRLVCFVPRVRGRLSDVNGPRGGIDKQCQVALMTNNTDSVVVTSIARDWRSALRGVSTRATRALLHNWQRACNQQRSRPPALTLHS